MSADDQITEALKSAYKKHVLNDESIGWNELSDILCNALCEQIGDSGFQQWLNHQNTKE